MPLDVIDIKTVYGSWPKRPLDLSADDLVAAMQQNGIGRALATSTMAILYEDVQGNEQTLADCTTRPALIPSATMHPFNYLGTEHRIAALKEKGFRIFRFCNKLQGFGMDLYCLKLMLRDLQQAGLPCIIDSMAMEDPYRIARLSAEAEVDVIVSNLGYTYEAEVIALGRDYPHLYFDAGRLTGPDGISLFAKHVGVHRLVYGSDYPFDAFAPSLLLVQQSGLSDSDVQKVLADNVKELLHL
ncbi:MAG: amidohydrolase family protein [Anaerolineae bacterium]